MFGNNTKRYSSAIIWLTASRIISMAISFIVTAYVIRSFGPDAYGIVSYGVSVVGIFSIIATLGMDQVLYRELIQNPHRRNALLGTSVILRIILAVCAMTVISIFSYTTVEDTRVFLIIMILSLGYLFSVFSAISFELQSKIRGANLALIGIATVIILSVLKLFVVSSGGGPVALATVLASEGLITGTLLILVYIYAYRDIRTWSWDRGLAYKIFIDSLPLAGVAAAGMIYARIDQVMLYHAVDATAVGLYDAGVRIAELWYFIPNILIQTLFPALASVIDTREFTKRARYMFLALIALGIFASGITSVLAPIIVNILYGNAFAGTTLVIQVYIWSSVGTFVWATMNYVFLARNMRKALVVPPIMGMVINIGLNLILIPRFGIYGAALATTLSYSAIIIVPLLFQESRTLLWTIITNRHHEPRNT